MPSESILRLKNYYENDRQSIGDQLILTCLKECTRYRRGTAFFASSSFLTYADALYHVIQNNVKIEILCSPVINDSGMINLLQSNITPEERIETIQRYQEDILRKALKYKENPQHKKYLASEMLAYLVANNQLIIKIAIKKKDTWPDPWPTEEDVDKHSHLYHVKRGYFVFEDEKKVVFDGSFNETQGSLQDHGEHASVYKSWKKDIEGKWAESRIKRIDQDWECENDNLLIRDLSKELLEKIRESADKNKKIRGPHHKPDIPPQSSPPKPTPEPINDEKKWRHKDEALKIFLEKKAGILAMATGTGKTSTAISIANRLFKDNLIDSVVITMVGNPLLSQWDESLSKDEEMSKRVVVRHYNQKWQMQNFITNSEDRVLLITSDQLGEFMRFYPEERSKRTLIVYDEVHDMAAPSRQESTKGSHQKFTYRLGLSATPDRGKFDDEGTDFLISEIGPIIFEFTIGDAIKRGILVEFDYKPLFFELTDEDKQKIKGIIGLRHSKDPSRRISEKDAAMRMANVKKESDNMLLAFDSFLKKEGIGNLNRSIIFVNSESFGEKVIKIINERGFTSYNKFINTKGTENLEKLADNSIECLITCRKVSQGIDLSSLNSIIIFASAVNPRETIQRLGRALRTEEANPDKRAFLLDFCTIEEEGDEEKSDTVRMKWLTELAKNKREE